MLNAAAPIVGISFLAPDISFNIRFYETTNNGGTDGLCEDGLAPNIFGTVHENGCADIFVLVNPEALTQSFIIDDFEYTLTIGFNNNNALSAINFGSVGLSFRYAKRQKNKNT